MCTLSLNWRFHRFLTRHCYVRKLFILNNLSNGQNINRAREMKTSQCYVVNQRYLFKERDKQNHTSRFGYRFKHILLKTIYTGKYYWNRFRKYLKRNNPQNRRGTKRPLLFRLLLGQINRYIGPMSLAKSIVRKQIRVFHILRFIIMKYNKNFWHIRFVFFFFLL